MLFEEKLIFFPKRYPEGMWDPQVPVGYTLEDVYFSSGKLKLNGWFISPETPKYAGAVLLCHGNAGNITTKTE